jgi:hypothetical protein
MVTRGRVIFTTDEANRSLPLVRSIVSDVAQLWHDLMKVRDDYGNSSPEHDRIMRELAEYIQELQEIGCHLRDFEDGIVDFPTFVNGRETTIAWRLGEDHVSAGRNEPSPSRGEALSVPGLEGIDEDAMD